MNTFQRDIETLCRWLLCAVMLFQTGIVWGQDGNRMFAEAQWIAMEANRADLHIVPGLHLQSGVRRVYGDQKLPTYRLPLLRKDFTVRKGIMQATATDAVLGGSNSSYQVGFLNENSTFSGLLQAKSFVKMGSGKLTLKTAGHTSPITVSGGTLELQNTSTNVLCSGLITVAKGAMLSGTATVQQVTMQTGSTFLCVLTATSNSQLTVKGNLTHNGDTLQVYIPSTRKLKEGEELTVFHVTGKHTGDVIIKAIADDGTVYDFDASQLLTDGKLVVTGVASGISTVLATDTPVDVYSTEGTKLRSAIPYGQALDGLPAGVYIVNRRKIIVK